MADEKPGGMQIGRVLREGRRRAGLDVAAVEERTKIRTRYLRALENEEWEALPSPAYAKGFLRTYAQLLGLDGEALVDEFRRQVESGREGEPVGLGEQVLERRRPLAGAPGDGPRPGLWIAAALAALVVVLAVIGLTGGDEDERPGGDARRAAQAREQKREAAARRARRAERRERRAEEAASVRLELRVRAPVAVCLLDESKRALIDGQLLAAGSTEGPWEAERFLLRFPSGYDRSQFRLLLDGEPRRVPEAVGPTAYEVVPPRRLRPAPDPGTACP